MCFILDGRRASGLPFWYTWRSTLDERRTTREAAIAKHSDLPSESINAVALFRRLEEFMRANSSIVADGITAYSLMELDTYTKMNLKVSIVGNNGSWE